jgi:hypothetical protein
MTTPRVEMNYGDGNRGRERGQSRTASKRSFTVYHLSALRRSQQSLKRQERLFANLSFSASDSSHESQSSQTRAHQLVVLSSVLAQCNAQLSAATVCASRLLQRSSQADAIGSYPIFPTTMPAFRSDVATSRPRCDADKPGRRVLGSAAWSSPQHLQMGLRVALQLHPRPKT